MHIPKTVAILAIEMDFGVGRYQDNDFDTVLIVRRDFNGAEVVVWGAVRDGGLEIMGYKN